MTLPQNLLASAIACLAMAGSAHAVTVYGLGTDNHLYRFDSATPGNVVDIGLISQAGIVDIDIHAANSTLYGMTSNGNAYGISTTTAGANQLVTPGSSLTGVENFDFNPAADRFRLSLTGGGNMRMAPDFITAPSGSAPSGTVLNDGFYSGAPGISVMATAYTNPFDSPGPATHATVLYSIGSNGVLYSHSTASGDPVGSFGLMTAIGSGLAGGVGSNVGFDIGLNGVGYVNNGSAFYSVNLQTGVFTSLGSIGAPIASVAVIPEPSSLALGALAGIGLLRRRRRA